MCVCVQHACVCVRACLDVCTLLEHCSNQHGRDMFPGPHCYGAAVDSAGVCVCIFARGIQRAVGGEGVSLRERRGLNIPHETQQS